MSWGTPTTVPTGPDQTENPRLRSALRSCSVAFVSTTTITDTIAPCLVCGASAEQCDANLSHHHEACCEACEWEDAHYDGPSGTVTVRDGQVVTS